MATTHRESAVSLALSAVAYILGDDTLRERFVALSGLTPDELRVNLQSQDFLMSALEFLVMHEPDLINCATALDEDPKNLVTAWRSLGGGVGQEW